MKEHIFYRFGIPRTITINPGTMFMLGKFEGFATCMQIKLLNFSPYYAQANGQINASKGGLLT